MKSKSITSKIEAFVSKFESLKKKSSRGKTAARIKSIETDLKTTLGLQQKIQELKDMLKSSKRELKARIKLLDRSGKDLKRELNEDIVAAAGTNKVTAKKRTSVVKSIVDSITPVIKKRGRKKAAAKIINKKPAKKTRKVIVVKPKGRPGRKKKVTVPKAETPVNAKKPEAQIKSKVSAKKPEAQIKAKVSAKKPEAQIKPKARVPRKRTVRKPAVKAVKIANETAGTNGNQPVEGA
jgi:hypothetical protein